MTLGERIVSLRKQHGLSQDSLAEAVGVSRQSVSKWELNASVPDLDKLMRLSEVFGVTLDELVKGASPPPPDPAAAPSPTAEELRHHRQKLAGIILIAVALGVTLLAFGLIVYTLPLFLLGLVCLLSKSRLALALGWTLWGYALFWTKTFLRFPLVERIFDPSYWQRYSDIAWISLLQLAVLLLLVWRTVRRPPGLAACWTIWLGLLGAVWGADLVTMALLQPPRLDPASPTSPLSRLLPRVFSPSYYHLENLMGILLGWGYLLAFVYLLRRTWRELRSRA